MLPLYMSPRSQSQAAADPHLLVSGSTAEGVARSRCTSPGGAGHRLSVCAAGIAGWLHTPQLGATGGEGRAKAPPDPAAGGEGGILSPSLPSVAGSRLPSLLMHPAAPSSLPAAWLHPLLAAGPPDVGASDPTSPGSSVASCCRGTNLDSRRQQGWWLRAAAAADAATRSAWLCSCHFSGRITNFQGRGRGEQPFGRLLSSDSSARALKQTTGKRRLLLRICQPDAAWL